MGDIIMWGKTKQEHVYTLEGVLRTLENAALNKGKCQVLATLIFLGHLLYKEGIKINESI